MSVFDSNKTLDEFNRWFKEAATQDALPAIPSIHTSFQLSSALCSGIVSKEVNGYDFLMQMPVDDCAEWVRKAVRSYVRLHRERPAEFPPMNFVEALDAVRAERKRRRGVSVV